MCVFFVLSLLCFTVSSHILSTSNICPLLVCCRHLFYCSCISFMFLYLTISSLSLQTCDIPETAAFTLAPSQASSLPKPCSVPRWDLLQSLDRGKAEFPLPLRHMLFSALSKPDARPTAWSLPAPVRPDFPRQSVCVPVEADPVGGLSSRWGNRCLSEER